MAAVFSWICEFIESKGLLQLQLNYCFFFLPGNMLFSVEPLKKKLTKNNTVIIYPPGKIKVLFILVPVEDGER